MKSDSSLLKDGKPFFIPDFSFFILFHTFAPSKST
jgi:hypothetical protein